MLLRLRQLWDWIIDRQQMANVEKPLRAPVSRAILSRPVTAARPSVAPSTPGAGSGAGHTYETQWGCVARVMQAAVETAGRARELQEQAALQIDSATYAFGSLIEELSAVMPVTGVESGWGKRATVHALAPARITPRRALAA